MSDPWNDDTVEVKFEIDNKTITANIPRYYFASLEIGGVKDAMQEMKDLLEEEIFMTLLVKRYPELMK